MAAPQQETMDSGLSKAVIDHIQYLVLEKFKMDGVRDGNFVFLDYNQQLLAQASTTVTPKHYTALSVAKANHVIRNGGNQNTRVQSDYACGTYGYYCCGPCPGQCGGYFCVRMGCQKSFNGQGSVLITTQDQRKYVAAVSTNIMDDNEDLAIIEHALGTFPEMRKELDGSWFYCASNAAKLPTNPQDENVDALGWLDPNTDHSVPPETNPDASPQTDRTASP
eukprot:CAMPEP_0194479662 /NCGR_PEP_ID=MMETSP0253-20130528/2712_1 /TAXON_ID=2966 /ORGANISM="Noctiluca scintillans" /LENGTH=221 /DNA_ID=CAMNT_0039318927 /DNA_START=53 /DNA_END=718 /DNA_ORIENTATION=+